MIFLFVFIITIVTADINIKVVGISPGAKVGSIEGLKVVGINNGISTQDFKIKKKFISLNPTTEVCYMDVGRFYSYSGSTYVAIPNGTICNPSVRFDGCASTSFRSNRSKSGGFFSFTKCRDNSIEVLMDGAKLDRGFLVFGEAGFGTTKVHLGPDDYGSIIGSIIIGGICVICFPKIPTPLCF